MHTSVLNYNIEEDKQIDIFNKTEGEMRPWNLHYKDLTFSFLAYRVAVTSFNFSNLKEFLLFLLLFFPFLFFSADFAAFRGGAYAFRGGADSLRKGAFLLLGATAAVRGGATAFRGGAAFFCTGTTFWLIGAGSPLKLGRFAFFFLFFLSNLLDSVGFLLLT